MRRTCGRKREVMKYDEQNIVIFSRYPRAISVRISKTIRWTTLIAHIKDMRYAYEILVAKTVQNAT